MGSREPRVKKAGAATTDRRFNYGNKLRPKYESPTDMQENLNTEPVRVAPKSTRLRPPMQNLAFDPRVIRGSATHKTKFNPDDEPTYKPRPPKSRTVRLADTPEPVAGRQHMDVQTDLYLEDQTAKKTTNDFTTQTDPFLDRPATPFFIPWKSGPDVFTQIFEGDLFEFDMEVEPMLEVLVGRSLEQGFMEVLEEKQLEHLRCHQDRFEQLRVAELVATQRMEASERRAMEEKARRVAQEKKRLREEELLRLKIEAQNVARAYLKMITEEVFDKLTRKGYFYDPVERELEEVYVPVLLKQMSAEIGEVVCSRHAVSIMVDEVVPPPDTDEKAADAVNLLMARMMDILDSWIVFEDNVMEELDAAETASQSVMRGVVGELELVDLTTTAVTGTLLDRVEAGSIETGTAARDIVDQLLGRVRGR